MQDSIAIDETDLALIHALQIAPRAPWTTVGAVLGISAVTAARRWERLVGEGLAWVTGYPGPALWRQQCFAWVEVDCEPALRQQVIDALLDDPHTASIEVMASGRDLYLTVVAADIRTLSRFVLLRASSLPGVRGTRTRIATQVFGEGSRWRLDALTPAQRERLASRESSPRDAGEVAVLQSAERLLLPGLADDGRRSAAELAVMSQCSEPTARRRLAHILQTRLVSLRCEVAQVIAGWPITATCWASVPPEALAETARILVTLPEVRVCAAVTGASNLVVTVLLRALQDLQRLETLVARRLPQLTFTDRAVTLVQVKRMGAVLDDSGHRLRTVPVDPWAEPAPLGAP